MEDDSVSALTEESTAACTRKRKASSEGNSLSVPAVTCGGILKRDLSPTEDPAQFSYIFCSAYNKFDKDNFVLLLDQFCTQDLVLIIECIGDYVFPSAPKYFEIHRQNMVVAYWESVFLATPDYVFTVDRTDVISLPNDHVDVISYYSYGGTQLYRINGLVENKEKRVLFTDKAGGFGPGSAGSVAVDGGGSEGEGAGTKKNVNGAGSNNSSYADNADSLKAVILSHDVSGVGDTNKEFSEKVSDSFVAATAEASFALDCSTGPEVEHRVYSGTITYTLNKDRQIYSMKFSYL
jgi:hypothetical protein